MTQKSNGNAARWDRGCLEEWRAGHSEERREADAKLLSDIFNLAAKIPQMKEALDWANEHGVEFIVDRTSTANGYYASRTGVVALSARVLKNAATAVGTVSHEIRHAWQDWHGLAVIPLSGRFSDLFVRLVLTEADAEAFGARARQQYLLRQKQESYRHGLYKLLPMEKRIAKLEQQIERLQRSPETLWQGFLSWFRRGRAAVYGEDVVKELAHALGVPGIEPGKRTAEFRPFAGREMPARPTVDFTDEGQLRRLGKGFTGANYFNGAARRESLRSIFRPDMAERFYSSARKRPKLMDEIRKRAMLLKLHRRRETKSPAPG